MPTNAKEFVLNLERFTDSRPENVAKIQAVATLFIQAEVMRDSPVDTGRFRANWQVQADGFATGEIDRTNSAPRGSLDTAGVMAANAEAKKIRPFTLSGVSNNLPYARRLNDPPGHSQQTSPGMVERAVAKATRIQPRVE